MGRRVGCPPSQQYPVSCLHLYSPQRSCVSTLTRSMLRFRMTSPRPYVPSFYVVLTPPPYSMLANYFCLVSIDTYLPSHLQLPRYSVCMHLLGNYCLVPSLACSLSCILCCCILRSCTQPIYVLRFASLYMFYGRPILCARRVRRMILLSAFYSPTRVNSILRIQGRHTTRGRRWL